jgi:hypothetical protein
MKGDWLSGLLSWWAFVALTAVSIFWGRRRSTLEWSQKHPTLKGMAVAFVIIGAALFLIFDPLTILLFVVFGLCFVFAAFLDPKTYSKSKPRH